MTTPSKHKSATVSGGVATDKSNQTERSLMGQQKRLREFSIVVTVIGVLGFCTALPRIFSAMDGDGQVPQIGIVVFGFWLLLIVVAYFLSNRLLVDEADQ